MEKEELESLVFALRDEVSELRSQIQCLESEKCISEYQHLKEIKHFTRDVVDHLNEMYYDLSDVKRKLDKHCKQFHCIAIVGGEKDESNISRC